MIKFNLLSEKKENVIYEEVLTNLFFDGLRDGEYGFIIKMDNNNNNLLHWETNGDLSIEPIPIYDIHFEYQRQPIHVGNNYIPGVFSGFIRFEYNREDLDSIFNKTRLSSFLYGTQIILITPRGKVKIKGIINHELTKMMIISSENNNNIYFNIENYETII